MKTVRVGAATGFYRDTIWPSVRSMEGSEPGYLCFDALAEQLMAVLLQDNEVFLRLSVRTKTREEAQNIGRLFPPLNLSGLPFTTAGEMRRTRGLLGMCPILVPKEMVEEQIKVEVA